MGPNDERFLRWLREDIGSALRGVLSYHGREFEVYYLRADLKGDDAWRSNVRADLPDLVEIARGEHAASDLVLFGDFAGTVRVFSNAVLVQFPVSENAGYGVSLDTDVTPRLVGFMNTAAAHLEQERA
ncbi:hypothetical protein [Salarchaeum sp. JOR-1]|uniref:DUF7522 family protein n=1 Tax=Salarchaeum sp. JOR-1 TaxID=2599399 RepID=UPI0011988C52|nr:hypothetical protein [Salarchaeum sp. JOR-1]QDX39737.1 hypothetical protein FQU85_02055 [Salarchaeum sp. JOR-1]